MKPTDSTPWRSPMRYAKAKQSGEFAQEEAPSREVNPRLQRRKPSVVPQKETRADVRRFELVLVEIGLIFSLSLLLGLVKMPMQWQQEFEMVEQETVVVQMEEIEQTLQIKKPPPPPRPPVPVSVPDDTILEDEVLDIDAEIDFDEPIDIPPPPPPPASESEAETEIFVVVEEMPELIGGLASLYAVIEYPELALRAGIEGTVVVQFVIETDGTPTDIVTMRSAGNILDAAALKAIAKLKFKPGMQRGKPVRVRYAMPVRFRLTEAKSNS